MIRGQIVIDASVVVEYLIELTLTRQASALFDVLRDPDEDLDLWAPDLIYAEVASAIRKLVRLKSIPAAAGGRCIERLARLPITTTGTASLIADTWPLRDRFTTYDATYVCLATRLGCRLVTADQKLARAAGARIGIFLADIE